MSSKVSPTFVIENRPSGLELDRAPRRMSKARTHSAMDPYMSPDAPEVRPATVLIEPYRSVARGTTTIAERNENAWARVRYGALASTFIAASLFAAGCSAWIVMGGVIATAGFFALCTEVG